MPKATNKSATKQKKARDFLNRKDRSTFYDEAAQGLVDKFGYSRDGKVYVEKDTLTPDEKMEYYKALRNKLGQWFRHRNLAKSSDHTYVAEIVDFIKSAASPQPRKRSAISMYMDNKKKEKLTSEFAIHWSAVKNDLSQKKRLPKYNEFVQTCWKKELSNYRDEMEKNVQEEHDNAIRKWKEKIETFNGTPEDFEKAWGMAESVLPSFADGVADWPGAHVIIVAVSPSPSNGEITIQSVQSDCSKGRVKTLLPQFDEQGWKKLQEMVITYGKAFFCESENRRTEKKLNFYSAPEECKRRIVKTEDDGSDVEMGATVLDDSMNVDAEGNEKKDGADGKSEAGDADADGESEPDVTGDAGASGLCIENAGTDPKDINRPLGSTPIADDGLHVPVMMEKAVSVLPDDKSGANTYPFPTLNGGNPLSPGLSGLSPAVSTADINKDIFLSPGLSELSPAAPTTDINEGNPLSQILSPGIYGISPSASTADINGGISLSPGLSELSPAAPTTDINKGNPLSQILFPGISGLSPTAPTTDINRGNAISPGPDGGNPVSSGPSPTAPTTEINGENANPFALQFLHPARFNFPEETHHGTNVMGSTFNPYSCDFSLTSNNWSAFPAHSATPSLNPSTDFWFGNAEYNGLMCPQDTSGFPDGGFLGSLYEHLNPYLVPSSTYASPGPLVNHGQPMLGVPSHSLRVPTIQPVPAAFAPLPSSQDVPLPLEPCGAVSESLNAFPPTVDTTVQESAKVSDKGSNTSRGQKRKGDDAVAKPAKKACLKGAENETEVPGKSVADRELGEGTAKTDEANERAGKPTLSGRVPLMPTRLAEAGYQGKKKAVRTTGRKVQPTKKPKSKGNATKPASKGASKIAKKKVK